MKAILRICGLLIFIVTFCCLIRFDPISYAQTHIFPALDTNNTWTGTNTFNGALTIAGGCTGCGGGAGGSQYDVQVAGIGGALSGTNAFQYGATAGLLSHSETGSFLNGTNNFYNSLGLNTCNPSTAIAPYYAANGITGDTLTDAVSACVNLPSGNNTVTNVENAAIAGYAINNNPFTQNPFGGGSGTDAIGTKGLCYLTANNGACEGLVGEVVSSTGLTNGALVGAEVGIAPGNTGDTAWGFKTSTFGSTQITYDHYPAFDVPGPVVGTSVPTSGYRCDRASILVHTSSFADCLELNPVASGASENSQDIEFNATNSSSTTKTSYLYQTVTPDGNPNLTYYPGNNNASFSAPALITAGYGVSIAGCTTSGSHLGGIAGDFLSGTTGTCTVTLTFPVQSFVGWSCGGVMADITTTTDSLKQTAFTTTTVTYSGTTVSGDTIVYGTCAGF